MVNWIIPKFIIKTVYEFRKNFNIREKDRGNSYAESLDRWYAIRFPNVYNVFDLLDAYANCIEVDVVEVSTIYRKIYSPDDELSQQQWYLNTCELPAAWDVSRGSEDIIIGIVLLFHVYFECLNVYVHDKSTSDLLFNFEYLANLCQRK